MNRPTTILPALLLAAALSTTAVAAGTPWRAPPPDHPYWNDLARFMAGMQIREGSSLHGLAQGATYRTHRAEMDKFWALMQQGSLKAIVPWRDRQIPASGADLPAFYPLSGGDFVNVYLFFPRAREYLMMALEKPGGIPRPLTLSQHRLASGLHSVRLVLHDIGRRNYILSASMRAYMVNTNLTGTAPVLLAFMARLGLTVTHVRAVGISPTGTVVNRNARPTPKLEGVEIAFLRSPLNGLDKRPSPATPASSPSPTRGYVRYFSVRFGWQSGEARSPEGAYLLGIKRLNTMLKAAVYLLHFTPWTGLRNLILQRSQTIIQDDSGIPYRYFDHKLWDIRLYGTFIRPIPMKEIKPHVPHQPDLASAYLKKKHPLPFDYGYGVLRGRLRSNLMLATRR